MRFTPLASKYPEYCALRTQSQTWAQVWQLGHGILWVCLLSLPAVAAAWWVSRDDPEPHRDPVWSLVAPVLLVAAIGVAVKRYALKRGRVSNASPR